MWERIRVILRKEFIQALREPRMRILLFVPPILQSIIFGFAVNLDVDTATIAWMDQDNTPQSHDLRAEFESSGHFLVKATPSDERQMQALLDRGFAPPTLTHARASVVRRKSNAIRCASLQAVSVHCGR